jgi:tetratricopeptide (TPR) repeat protein
MRNGQLRFTIILALAFVQAISANPAFAQQPDRPNNQTSMQSQFDSATEAWDRDDCATALPIFAKLAIDPRIKVGSIAAAAIAVRRGDCFAQMGKSEEGEQLILTGLPQLKAAGASFSDEVAQAESQLGAIAMNRWDHDAALAHFQAALDLRQGVARQRVLMSIALLTSFDGDRRGLAAAEEGLQFSEAQPKPDKQGLAQWHIAHARILLNQGMVKEGQAELTKALGLAGGLTEHITLPLGAMRADLAQAAMLNHDNDAAYRYMAMSGAGRVEKSPFASAARMDSPDCGPETGLESQDLAVVEFASGMDGRVTASQPVYANGNYAKATAFARAVSQWTWKPEDVANLPIFYRLATRVEMRCSNASGVGGVSPLAPLQERFLQWAAPHLPANLAAGEHNSDWQRLQPAAEAAEAHGDEAAELAMRTLLAGRDLRGRSEAMISIERASTLLSSPKIPEQARASARVILTMAKDSPHFAIRAKTREAQSQLTNVALLSLADDPQIASDALAQDTALMLGIPLRPATVDAERTTTSIRRVAQDARLGEHHPLRQLAQLRLANDFARVGNLAEAQKWFGMTGLNQEQCALIGPKPALTHMNTNEFPVDALVWGFEGWVRSEFDINSDGSTATVRPVIAYPPFIFGKAATEMLTKARYQSSFRPEGGAACSANMEQINFRIPGNENTTRTVRSKH